MEYRILMSFLGLRSFFQRYHSLGEALKSAGMPAVYGVVESSRFRKAEVGRQVLLLYSPDWNRLSWYHDQFIGWPEPASSKAAPWVAMKPPPPLMYFSMAARWPASSG